MYRSRPNQTSVEAVVVGSVEVVVAVYYVVNQETTYTVYVVS